MSLKSLQLTPKERKQKCGTLKNQPKMTGFLVSSPKMSTEEQKVIKLKPETSNSKSFDEGKWGYLFGKSPSRSPHSAVQLPEQIVQVDSDESESDTGTNDSPIFPQRTIKIAKKPLFFHKSLVTSALMNPEKQCIAKSKNLVTKNNKESLVRNPLKEKKNVNCMEPKNKTTKPNGCNPPTFTSEITSDSDVPVAPKKKRFYSTLDSEDSESSNRDLATTETSPKRKQFKSVQDYGDDADFKSKGTKIEKSYDVIDTSTSSCSTAFSNSLNASALVDEIVCNSIDINSNLPMKVEEFRQVKQIEHKAKQRRVIRKSSVIASNGTSNSTRDTLRVNSKTVIRQEDVGFGAKIAYSEIYQSTETLLSMRLDRGICQNLKRAMECTRSQLANRYHVNFGFFMQRENYEGAIGSLRSVSRNHYPHKEDLHTVLYTILEKTNEESVVHHAQDLLYKVLCLHPPVNYAMRQYYRCVLSSRLSDSGTFGPWENIRNLLEDVIFNREEPGVFPGKLGSRISSVERQKAVLGFLVQLLYEDFRFWIHFTKDPSASLRNAKYVPLIANVLWSQTEIPHLNTTCRELISFHVKAVESSQPDLTFYTQPLVKMMAAITQLTDLQIPLRFRKPNEHMKNLAHDILNIAGDSLCYQQHFLSSFGSRELKLLTSLALLDRLRLGTGATSPGTLSLQSLIQVYLKMDDVTEPNSILENFKLESIELKTAFLNALCGYLTIYGSLKTWFHMHNEQFNITRTKAVAEQTEPEFPIKMFSKSFTPHSLMKDLRQAKLLFDKCISSEKNPRRTLFSCLCLENRL